VNKRGRLDLVSLFAEAGLLALETRSWFVDAVRLRRWDDAAKVAGAVCPPLIEYAPLLERHFGPQVWMRAAGIDRGA
jgi:hypothetical protein